VNYRRLGSSDLEVSEISLGSWLTFGGGIARERAEACVATAFEVGINLIDTANVYSGGRAEEFLGAVLAGRPRDSYVLATKLFWPMPDGGRGLSREQVFTQLDGSLRRLQTDYVDLYQCHRYDWSTPLEETMEALTEVVRQGKVRYLGFSEWPAEKIRAAQALAGTERFVSSQPQYSLVWRGPELDVIPTCRDLGISQIVWSPLAQGILTAKYRPGEPPPPETRAASASMGVFLDLARERRLLERVQQVAELARSLGITPAQLALAWVLREPNVASAIVGASRPEQVVENAAASRVRLDDETLRRIDEILGDSVSREGPDS
jgi:aryl-alcohol dehydrogenase-like predicted oxidoreductase